MWPWRCRTTGTSETDIHEDGDGGSGVDVRWATEATGTWMDDNRLMGFCSTLELGFIVRDNVGGKETPGRLHSFAFPSGTGKRK